MKDVGPNGAEPWSYKGTRPRHDTQTDGSLGTFEGLNSLGMWDILQGASID